MQGQHIFVRCFDNGGQGATCTAAVTKGIVSDGVIREKIEPLCIVRETFASEWLNSSKDSILKIYHPDDKTTVVSRSTWEQDRITERENGRTGVYTVSHVLTEEDSQRFVHDFAGAFSITNFESYDALVADMKARNSERVALDTSFSLFSGVHPDPDFSILDEVGFTESTFRRFFYLLCEAVSKGTQVKLVLPDMIANRWKTEGVDVAEPLIYAIMSLLPEYIRSRLGVVSHWGGDTDGSAVAGIHLLVVHPRSEIEYNKLKENAMKPNGNVILLGEPACSDVKPVTVEFHEIDHTGFIEDPLEFFSMIWRSRHDGTYGEFYNYSKEMTGNLYSRMLGDNAPSGAVMMAMYYIWKGQLPTATIEDRVSCVVCMLYYVGLTGRLPEINRLVGECTNTILEYVSGSENKLEVLHILKALELPLVRLLVKRSATEKYLDDVYSLVSLIIEGTNTRQKETLCIFAAEMEKNDDAVAEWLTTYYQEFVSATDDEYLFERINGNRGAVLSVAMSIQKVLFEREKMNATEMFLYEVTSQAFERFLWIFREKQEWESLLPVGEFYMNYLKNGGCDTLLNRAAIVFLLDASCAQGNCRHDYLSLKWKVEKIIYSDTTLRLSDGERRFHLFAECVSSRFPLPAEYDVDAAVEMYECLCRVACSGDPVVLNKVVEAYGEEMKAAETEFVRSRFLAGVESVSGHFWSKLGVCKAVCALEKKNLETSSYQPSADVMDRILRLCLVEELSTRTLLTGLFHRLDEHRCNDLCAIIKKLEMHPLYYLYIQLGDETTKHLISQSKLEMIEGLFDGSRKEFWEMMEKSSSIMDLHESEVQIHGFQHIYRRVLEKTIVLRTANLREYEFGGMEKELAETEESMSQIVEALQEESIQVRKMRETEHPLSSAAKITLQDFAKQILCSMSVKNITGLSPKEVEIVAKMLESLGVSYANETRKAVLTVHELDKVAREDARANGLDRGLFQICTGAKLKSEQCLIAERLRYYIRKRPSFLPRSEMHPHVLCMYCAWLESKWMGVEYTFSAFEMINTRYARLSKVDQVRVLFELAKRGRNAEFVRVYKNEAYKLLRDYPELLEYPDIQSNKSMYFGGGSAKFYVNNNEFTASDFLCCIVAALFSLILIVLSAWLTFMLLKFNVLVAIGMEALLVLIFVILAIMMFYNGNGTCRDRRGY